MALKMRPTGLGAGINQDPQDFTAERTASPSSLRGALRSNGCLGPEPEARPAGWLPMKEKYEDNLDRVWNIIEKVGVAMLTTQFSGGLRARPLEARPERDAGLIWFVTDVRSGKD